MFSSTKDLSCAFALLGFLSCCNAASIEALIGKNHVGPISIGDAKIDILSKWGDRVKEESIMLEGELYPVYSMTFNDSHSIIIEFSENDKVSGFRISDAYFATKENIKVGSSFKEVIDAYPEYDLYSGLEEGGYLSIGVEGIGVVFSFDPTILADGLIENYEKFYDLKVKNILVH